METTTIREPVSASKSKIKEMKTKLKKSRQLYLFVLPAFLIILLFSYGPMYGVIIAFKDYMPSLGIFESPWVGFKHFQRFFDSYYFWDLMKNTLGISLYSLIVGFPLPIILALALNEIKDGPFKKITQTVTYAPNFIAVVVMVGMVIAFLSPSTGIIFLAALSGVDTQLHEAATIDGASRLQRVWYINIPTIMPTMVILLIMSFGSLMSVGFEKIILMQNPLNMESSNVIATFVYQQGLLDAQYSFAAAVGLFNSLINSILLILVNGIAKRLSDSSLL